MQAPEPPTAIASSHRGSSYYLNRGLVPTATRPIYSAAYSQHCAPAADAALERPSGRAMHIRALPPPTSLPPPALGRRQEPVSSLPNSHPQFSPARSEPHSYPSPPMSDSHSPNRRSAHLVEAEGHRYPPPLNDARRLEAFPPPRPLPPPFDHRPTTSTYGMQHQRPLYPGEAPRGQPLHYQHSPPVEPHYGSVPLVQPYAYGYPPPGMSGYPGTRGPGPQGQPIPPPYKKQSRNLDRTKPKAHVASACVNCKKAHLSCDIQRPCGRCISSGKQESCKDVQHKKRGRPRLRDDKDFSRSEEGRHAPTPLLGAAPASPAAPSNFHQHSAFPLSHRDTDPLRILRTSMREPENTSTLQQQPYTQSAEVRTGGYDTITHSRYASGPGPQQPLPIAFLNLDLVILKSNQAFQDLVAFLGDIQGKSMVDLLEFRSTEVLHRIRNELRNEREEREPTYMAPITPSGQDPVQSVSEKDVDQVSEGYMDRSFLLNFRLPNGQHQSLKTQIRLAKTSLYFVTLVVHTPPRPAGPPLLTQHVSAPTPPRTSQSLSASTNGAARDFGSYPVRPLSSAGSAPSSPYFNFNTVRTSLPNLTSSTYGISPLHHYSPTAGAEQQGYFPTTIQPPLHPTTHPSPYPPISRNGSIIPESPVRQEVVNEPNRSDRLQGLQLPPIRTGPPPLLNSPLAQEFGESIRERVRPRGSPSMAERTDTPDSGKRRRLNIHEVLE